MALNRQITIIAIVLAACLTCGGQNETKPDAGEMRGRVTEVDRANVSQNPKLLGSILIEGDRPSPNDKVVANITTDTRIFEQQGNARVSVAFEALKVGQMVSAKFTGPALMSYPARVGASEVVILAVPAQESSRSANQPDNNQTAPPSQRSMREIVMKPVVYRVEGMDKVTVKSDLKYTAVNDPNLLMDVYAPPNLNKSDRKPAVIFIHGGAGSETTPKDWGIYTSWGRLIAASGLIGITFTHRLSAQKTSLEDAASDVAAAVSYIRANADTLKIDRDRICLAAYSAGGSLLSMALRDKPEYVRCLVGFYAFMDIQQSGNLFAAIESPEILRKFSPITYLTNDSTKIAPLFIARAGRDQVPTMDDSIDRFIREALAKNVALTLANHPEGVHGFDNQNDDERSREIIRSAIAFMKFHLGVDQK